MLYDTAHIVYRCENKNLNAKNPIIHNDEDDPEWDVESWMIDMFDDKEIILCASSAYDKKFYLNEDFNKLPDEIKDDLKIMCVLFTEEVGGILKLVFDEEGTLMFRTEVDEGDLLYDDIACGMLIKKLQYEKRELLESVEMFYKVFFMGIE